MAQTSLTPKKRTFDDPAKARAAGLKARRGAPLPPEYRQLRQHHVVEMKLKGMTVQAIADHFGVHSSTIDQDLKTIKRDGLLEKFERRILGRLMPKVVTKLERLLDKDDDNLEAVTAVMKFFTTSHQQKFEREQAVEGGQQEDSFEAWVREWQAKREDATAPPVGAIDAEEITVERIDAVCAGGASQAAKGDEATSETRVDASGDAGPGSLSRAGAEEVAPAASPDTSETGLATGGAEKVASTPIDPDCGREPAVEGGIRSHRPPDRPLC